MNELTKKVILNKKMLELCSTKMRKYKRCFIYICIWTMEMVEHCTSKICDGTELPMLKLKSYNFQSKRDSAFWLILHHHTEAQHPARLRPAHCSIHPKDAERPGAGQNGGIYPTSLRQRKKKLHAALLKWTDTVYGYEQMHRRYKCMKSWELTESVNLR